MLIRHLFFSSKFIIRSSKQIVEIYVCVQVMEPCQLRKVRIAKQVKTARKNLIFGKASPY